MDRIEFDTRPAMIADDSAAGLPDLNRRHFLVTSLAAGFAVAAVTPALAQAIHTSDEGLVAGEVKIPVADGAIPAYRAHPAVGGPFPTVLVIQEIFGVHEHIKDVCRRLAKLGYYAIAPEMYARQGDVSKLESIKDIMTQVVSKVPDAQVNGDLDAAVAFARASGKADVARLGVTGFCWGGRAVWLYAAHNPAVKAGVSWYGLLGAPPWNPKGTSAISVGKTVKVPVLGLYASKDGFIPNADVDAMKAQIRRSKSQIVVYQDVDHGFNADYRPTYNASAAYDGWRRMQEWFKSNGVG